MIKLTIIERKISFGMCFFVLMLIILVCSFIPFYIASSKYSKNQQESTKIIDGMSTTTPKEGM